MHEQNIPEGLLEEATPTMQQAGRYYRQFHQARGTLGRIAVFLTSMPGRPKRTGIDFPGNPIVSIENARFGYPGSAKFVVDGVSLTARPGEILAVVGPNGAGKSTLMDLLLGLQMPLSGQVTIGSVPLENIDEGALREATAVLSQDVFLFHATLAENIGYGCLGASETDIAEAANRAGLAPLIQRLPQGLHTMLGDRGSKLSGGERQRAAIARVLIRNPSIVVFDEPTSQLDGAAVRDAGKVLCENAANRVTFIIAHRIDTVRIATRVLVMDQGKIVAEGTPEQLEHANPLFCKLFTIPVHDQGR